MTVECRLSSTTDQESFRARKGKNNAQRIAKKKSAGMNFSTRKRGNEGFKLQNYVSAWSGFVDPTVGPGSGSGEVAKWPVNRDPL